MSGIAYRRIGDWSTQQAQQLRVQLAQQESTVEALVQHARAVDLATEELRRSTEELRRSIAGLGERLSEIEEYSPVHCDVGFNNNSTATPISSSGVFEQVTQATWDIADAEGFELGAGDVSLVYTGPSGRRVFWAVTCNMLLTTGSLQATRFRLASGGVVVGRYAARLIIASQIEQQDQLHGLLELSNGDEFTLEVRNDSNSNDITAVRMSLQMFEVY